MVHKFTLGAASTITVTVRCFDWSDYGGWRATSERGGRSTARRFQREVRDQKFGITFPDFLLRAIRKSNFANVETVEAFPHFGEVVQGENEFALDLPQMLFELDEILFGEIELVEFAIPIGRVQVEERLRAIISPQDIFVGQALDLNFFESLMRIFNKLGKFSWLVVRRLGDAVVVVLSQNQSAESIFLEIEEPRGSLDVRQRFRILGLEQRKQSSAHQTILQISHKLFMVRLADAKEIHDFTILVIKYFNRRWFLVKENLSAPGERFYIGCMLREVLDDLVRNPIFSADVCERANHLV
jgi:hypothetical protein